MTIGNSLHFLLLATALTAFAQGPVRLTEIQVIGSHNSYHAGLAPSEAALLRQADAKTADSLDYRHPAIDVQLSAGVRQIEIDVYGDTKGGLFADPAYPHKVAQANLPPDPPFDPGGLMKKPGFKVIHAQDVDFRSNCQPFTGCLAVVRNWSKAHPRHLPIFILVENKAGKSRDYMVEPEKLTAATFEALDAEVRSVFAPGDMITPDDVRGKYKTLEEAVLAEGWPALDKARGKVIFLLDQARVTPIYTAGHPALEGRIFFTNAKPGTPDAAFVEVNDPTDTRIPDLVRKGYLVRTMTDPGRQGVREGLTARRDAALKSGAQLLSTDYPFDERDRESNYSVRFESGNARCNPIVRANACSAALLREDKAALSANPK